MMGATADSEGAGVTETIRPRCMAETDAVSQLTFLASDESSFIATERHAIEGGMIVL
jgi:hypothetical protein